MSGNGSVTAPLGRRWGWVAYVSACLFTGLWGWSLAVAASADVAPAHDQSLRVLREQLGAPAFTDRQKAMRMLARLGVKALPTVEEAATSDDAEVRARAIAILQSHLRDGHAELKGAAKAALERLAQGSGPAARAAALVLNPPPEPTPGDIQRRLAALQLRQLGQLQAAAGVVQVRAMANAAVVNRSATIQDANGKRVSIQQSGQRIKIEWTERPENGAPVVKQAEAASVEELKAKHPQAYEVYKEYAPRFGFPLVK